jgi:nicotinate phosphoribosyltransferase
VLARADETYPDGEPLLQPLMRNGRRFSTRKSASLVRESVLANIDRLPRQYHALRDAPEYPVQKSDALIQLLEQVRRQYVTAQNSAGAPRPR